MRLIVNFGRTTLLQGAVLKMQKTLFDFCARSTGERDEIPSSAESSLDLESSDVAQDTDSVISKYCLTYWPK